MIKEIHLKTVADVLKNLRPGEDEDSIFQREAAEAHILELLVSQPVPAEGAQRGEQWYCRYGIPCDNPALATPPATAAPAEQLIPTDVREFLTDLSRAMEYKSHDLGYEDSISNNWKSDAADLLKLQAPTPPSTPASKETK
jgi:hypothetical protein